MSAWLNLLKYFVIKDIKAKYAGSGLGLLWTAIIPLFQIFMYWLVFSTIMKSRPYGNANIPYTYFLLSSFFFWLAFSEGLIRSSSVILENAEIVKKVSFPNIVLPVAVTLSSYVMNMIGFLLFLSVFTVAVGFHATFFWVLPVLLLQIIFSLGLGMIVASLLPYVRDLAQILSYVVQALFFLSPIIYSLETVPPRFRVIFFLNPITYFTSSYQKLILSGESPPLAYLAAITLIASFFFAGGVLMFRKLNEGFSDVL